MVCRICSGAFHVLANLGTHPIANQYGGKIKFFEPLILVQCKECFVVQTDTSPIPSDIYNENYGYMTGNSKEWVEEHKEFYNGLDLYASESVLEIGSNDGSVLQNFKRATGFEPSKSAHDMAIAKGLNSINMPFYIENAEKLNLKGKFKTIIANNVLAHDANIMKIMKGIEYALEDRGLAIIELQDAVNLLNNGLYDCIYHEHYFHFNLETLSYLFSLFGFELFQSYSISHHGGSIRAIFVKTGRYGIEKKGQLIPSMQEKVDKKFGGITEFLKENPMPAFGAPAKAVTITNRCKLTLKEIPFIIDETPIKQGKKLPGTDIPILGFGMLTHGIPDKMLIFPWNFKEEIARKLRAISPKIRLYVLFPEIKEI